MSLTNVLLAASWLLAAGISGALVATRRRHWTLVVRIARPTAVLGGAVLTALALRTTVLFGAPSLVPIFYPQAATDTRDTAQLMAHTIHMLTKYGWIVLLESVTAAALWVIANRRKLIKVA
jgi:hypothetical protein